MNLNRKSFTYRLYSWCHILKNKLFCKDSTTWNGDIVIATNTNLCPMMRTIFLWTPVYLAILASLLGGIVYILFYLPGQFGGVVGYMNTYLIPGIVIGGIVGFIWGIVKLSEWCEHRPVESFEEMEARHEAGNYTFWEMFCNYIRARHEKVCPIVTVVEDVPLEDTTPDPEEKAAPGQPVPAPPPEDPQDIKTGPEPTERSEVGKAVDSIIESLNAMEEKPVSSNTNNSVEIRFLNKFSPNFTVFVATACVIGLVAGLNWGMAGIMGTDEVVFTKAPCNAFFDIEKHDGKIICGEFEKIDMNSVAFIVDTVILKKTTICEVTKGSFTDNIIFNCDYK